MLKAAPIFTDHMVLQREKPIRLWGTGDEGAIITAGLADVTGTAEVHNGAWEITLPPLPAGGAYTLRITDGTEELVFSDVMLGEIWLCGGQSNMELVLGASADPEEALAACRESGVRLYHVGKHAYFDAQFYQEEAESCWQLPTPEACRSWTAVGYHFAAELSRKLDVTVGLVECCYGGTSASAWMSEQTLRSTTVGQTYLEDYAHGTSGMTEAEANQAYLNYCRYHESWQQRVMACYAEDPDILWTEVLERCGENRYPGPWAPMHPLRPHGLYDTMICRIVPYTMRGVLYYQGESDDHRPEGYETLLRSLIAEWRRDFRDEALPFLLVQLPMFAYEETKSDTNWAIIREAQRKVCQTTRNTGLAVIPDCGELNEIHPKEKRTPAHRLYLQALREVYHLQTEGTTAPLLRTAIPEGSGMRLYFDNAEGGLVLHGTEGFELCGTDGIWHPAVPDANGDTIFVHSPEVTHPAYVRYAWINYGSVTLFAQNGLPASPFTTHPADTR